ncbi:NAD(P)/FAD-dependent oxidoreductase [Lysobacter brunescens]|uniref:NAD(P)/FAD-dependent oxidoreductase n=1 Tax=Lysobacter brunescens TaxID=262323 RepID=A0ABW2YKI2_9GAMM
MAALANRQDGADGRVVVIGGGVVGLACALRLRLAGVDCLVIDPMHDGQAASWGNAGHIAIEQVAPLASWATLRSLPRRWFGRGGPVDVPRPWSIAPWLWQFLRACSPRRHAAGQQALRGLLADAVPAWRRLLQDIGRPGLLREEGHWVVWESADSERRGLAAWLDGDIGEARATPLADRALAMLQARLDLPLRAGLCFEGSAQVSDTGKLMRALREALLDRGGQWLRAGVAGLAHADGRAGIVLDDSRRIDADRILIAAGPGSRSLMADLGEHAPLIEERGYHLQWRNHDWPDLPPLVFEDRSVILTRFDGGLRLAGFVEFVPPGLPPDVRKWQRLRAHAVALGLPVRGEPEAWCGARPTLPDYLPAIGRSRTAGNVCYAFGHQHLGLTLAAVTADRVLTLLDDPEGASAVAPFDLQRFAD